MQKVNNANILPQLVSVYDVLKDPNKRKHYDNVLDNGLPDWKQAVYYYRRVRKMGLKESAFIVFIIISIGQYLVGWGSYIEKKLAVVGVRWALNKVKLCFSNIGGSDLIEMENLKKYP